MQRLGEVLEVEVGYAAGPAGGGVAYAALNGAEGRRGSAPALPDRAPSPSWSERAVAYAALVTVARSLLQTRRYSRPFRDAGPSVCAKKSRAGATCRRHSYFPTFACGVRSTHFIDVEIGTGATDELMQRAGAEVALNVAA